MSLIGRATILLSTLALVAACGEKKSDNTMADPNIVYILDQASASDSARGALAETKGTNKDVYHQAVLETATKALGLAQNQELKDLISTAAPVLQRHLDRALELQKKMSGM